MKKHLPNFFTCLNLFSGCVACVMAFNGNYFFVVFFVILSAVFDFLDGFLARVLKASSPIGKDLDSLADMVSFGLAPSLIVFRYISQNLDDSLPLLLQNLLPYAAFLLAVFSALRLAKFNIDTRQKNSFVGLNTPANAMFWISLCYGLSKDYVATDTLMIVFFVLILCFSLLMVSEMPMFSLKVKSLKLKGNEQRCILIIFAITALLVFKIAGIAITIVFYILLALIDLFRKKPSEQK